MCVIPTSKFIIFFSFSTGLFFQFLCPFSLSIFLFFSYVYLFLWFSTYFLVFSIFIIISLCCVSLELFIIGSFPVSFSFIFVLFKQFYTIKSCRVSGIRTRLWIFVAMFFLNFISVSPPFSSLCMCMSISPSLFRMDEHYQGRDGGHLLHALAVSEVICSSFIQGKTWSTAAVTAAGVIRKKQATTTKYCFRQVLCSTYLILGNS